MDDHEQVRAAEPPTPRSVAPVSGRAEGAGDAAVDEALRALDGLAQRPLAEHVRVFDAVHGALQDRLAEAQG